MSAEIVPDVEGCLAENNTKWENSPITFDDVPNAYISLFQVATFKGWLAIMADATDSRNVRTDRHPLNYFVCAWLVCQECGMIVFIGMYCTVYMYLKTLH